MSLTVYGLKNCDTCKKALKALQAAGKTVTFVDIRAEADLESLLPQWSAKTPDDRLLNKKSTTWRNLTEDQKAMAEDDVEIMSLLIDNPTLIKRPVIEAGSAVFVGWSKTEQSALL
ncbi:MAG: ArsC/Spx/MgsR family protein [Pseudomonadota bacterium]